MYSEKNRRRFRNNVQVNQKSKCWVWVRALTKGYGRLYAGGQYVYAHRYLYEYINGPVPVALELHHICGNKSCVRPDHLVPVTHRENSRQAALDLAWAGERNGNAQLKELEVRRFRREYKQGVPVKKLAKDNDIPLRTMYAAIREETWRHVRP